MTPAATLLTLILTKGGLLPFADDVMQLKASGEVRVYAVTREVHIWGAAALAKKWKRGGICPHARARGKDLVLECKTDRLHAESHDGVVTLYSLRGMPWNASDEPAVRPFFPPESVGLGGPCPGTTPAGRAECALAQGKRDEAREQLSAALQTMYRDYAAMRMADLSLEAGDPLGAMEWLEKTGRTGPWGRLASLRQCELSGRCLKGPTRDALFDTAGMPKPLEREVQLRELRQLRFESPSQAIAKLFERGGGQWPDALCGADYLGLCFDVLHGALVSNDVEARITALTLFASGPVSQPNERRPELSDAAADAALSLGAAQYAAAALAAATPDVKKPALARHLKKVVQLYALSGQPARASAVLAYAMDTVGPEAKKWKLGGKRVAGRAADEVEAFPTRDAELANELATAMLMRSRARKTR